MFVVFVKTEMTPQVLAFAKQESLALPEREETVLPVMPVVKIVEDLGLKLVLSVTKQRLGWD